MNTFTLFIACLLVAGARSAAVVPYGVPHTVSVVHQPLVHQPLVHQPLVHHPLVHQAVVAAPVVAQHKQLVYVPHHEHGYSVEHNSVVHPKSTVIHHDPLTGLPYQQTDYHHAPVVTGSRSYVHQSRPGYVAEHTKTYLL
ncbi:uncharacterized protein LOC125945581 [Dermacentor silvarum]|uniref:uncharacterized protein LOC125945581 n=1 Tax=Dermacentor silvarum TaxID=543639 RepID=UPI002101D38A|nr:uncharacterized protein LOC125945581 [Dermacentor silvarum]